MSFLKKLGIGIAKGIGIVSGFQPLLMQAGVPISTSATTVLGKVADTLTQIGGVVATAEGMFAAIGAEHGGGDKLKAATPFVAQFIQHSELLAGKKIKNEALFLQGCTAITSGMADVLNSLEGD